MGELPPTQDAPEYERLADLEAQLVEVILAKAMEFPDEYNAIKDFSPVSIKYGDNGDPLWSESAYATAKESIGAAVANLLEPWYGIPSPSRFAAPVESFRFALENLTGSDGATALEIRSDVELHVGGQVPLYMERIRANFTGWQGETVTAFRTNYIRRFGPMLAMQNNALMLLRMALEAEAVLWQAAQRKIIEVVEGSINAFDALNFWGDEANLKLAFDVAAAVAGVVGAMMSGPVGAIAAAAVGGTIAAAKDPISQPSEEVEGSEVDIEGTTIGDVWWSTRATIRALKDEIMRAEDDLGRLIGELYVAFGDGYVVDIGPEGESITRTGIELLRPPPLAAVTSAEADSNGDGVLSTDELVAGIDAPDEGYSPPNESDSY
jgi:hypothetical protein